MRLNIDENTDLGLGIISDIVSRANETVRTNALLPDEIDLVKDMRDVVINLYNYKLNGPYRV